MGVRPSAECPGGASRCRPASHQCSGRLAGCADRLPPMAGGQPCLALLDSHSWQHYDSRKFTGLRTIIGKLNRVSVISGRRKGKIAHPLGDSAVSRGSTRKRLWSPSIGCHDPVVCAPGRPPHPGAPSRMTNRPANVALPLDFQPLSDRPAPALGAAARRPARDAADPRGAQRRVANQPKQLVKE